MLFGLLLPSVGADRCSDQTAVIARSLGAQVVETSGGKVETQRACLVDAPFTLFMDADISVLPETIHGLCQTMLSEPSIQVAYPPKQPLSPKRRSWIAKAAYYYSKDEGFRKKRYWFDGKCFRNKSVHSKENATYVCQLNALHIRSQL